MIWTKFTNAGHRLMEAVLIVPNPQANGLKLFSNRLRLVFLNKEGQPLILGRLNNRHLAVTK